MNFRRIRGLIGSAILGAIPWSLLAVAWVFIINQRLIPGLYIRLSSAVPVNVYVLAALTGALFGAINGLLFGTLVIFTERNGSVANIRAPRFVAMGALASAVVMGLVTGSGMVALGAGILGAISSEATLWIARRAARNELAAGGEAATIAGT